MKWRKKERDRTTLKQKNIAEEVLTESGLMAEEALQKDVCWEKI